MSATRDALVSARVPRDLREDLERIAEADHVELSVVTRKALRMYADWRQRPTAPDLYGPGYGVPGRLALAGGDRGSHHRRAGATEVAAALKIAPKLGTQRRTVLELYEAAGHRGLTADDVVAALPNIAPNGLPRRVTDLLQGGLIGERAVGDPRELAPDEESLDGLVVRLTRHKTPATVYVISRRGRLELEAARDRERKTAA